ncbi:MAG TPA: hypothetical protein VJT31_27150 [Rugosimonospora sp.]|nr:hypothetical protein [Rugosimonospora sp.]
MTVADPVAPSGAATGDGGRLARWIRTDPVRAAAVALIAVQVVWRPQIAAQGFLAYDDFSLASRAADAHLNFTYLGTLFNNHFMPGGMLVTWVVTRLWGLSFTPYLVLMTVGQALVSIAFYRLLRQLLRPGWAQLVPLAVLLFSPLTLEVDSWCAVAVNLLPMQLAMVLAVGAQAKYVRSRHPKHLVSLGFSLLLGLVFFEKSLLITPFVFLLTACLFVPGGPVRAVLRTAVRYWQSWAVLVGVSLGYLALYAARAKSAGHSPASAGQAFTFVKQLLLDTLVPGLFGGPWQWFGTGDGPPVTAPADVPRWLSLGLLAALVVVTALARPVAIRAWALLLGYVVLVGVLLAVTRLGFYFSPAAGLAPRYVADVVVVAALCVGVALLGLRDPRPDGPSQDARVADWPPVTRSREAIAVALVVALGGYLLGSAWSAARFTDYWKVKQGREYLATVRTELAKVPAGSVFLDRAVPPGVQSPLSFPYNLQSQFLRPLAHRPVFVKQAADPLLIDDTGHVRHTLVQGVDSLPGTTADCGYRVDAGQTVQMHLTTPMYDWQWVARVGYYSSGETDARLVMGTGDGTWFHIEPGEHQSIFLVAGVGDTVQLTVQDPSVTVCFDKVTVGQAVPRP